MKQILLFFGSFNPLHNGHLALAEESRRCCKFDEVWFVLSPLNPFKKKQDMIDLEDRARMLEKVLKKYPAYKFCEVELSMPTPSYTIDTLEYLIQKYPDLKFSILTGKDNLTSFYRWKRAEDILQLCKLYVYPREQSCTAIDPNEKTPPHFSIEAPLYTISSTQIREMLQKKEDISNFVPKEVRDYFLSL